MILRRQIRVGVLWQAACPGGTRCSQHQPALPSLQQQRQQRQLLCQDRLQLLAAWVACRSWCLQQVG
jgi:hypothetical protein